MSHTQATPVSNYPSPISPLPACNVSSPPPTPRQPSSVPPPPPVRKVSPPSSVRTVFPPPPDQSQPSSISLPSPVRKVSPPPARSCSNSVSSQPPPTPPVHEVPPPSAQICATSVLPPPHSPSCPPPILATKQIPLSMPLKSTLPTPPTPSQLPAPNWPTPVSSSPPSPLPSPQTLPLLPSPTPPLPPSPSPSPPSTPTVYELMPPLPSSIAAASPNLSEDTEAQMNSRRVQEEANVPSIGNGGANPITKPQVQVPRNNHHNPDNTEGKPAHSDSNVTGIIEHGSSNCNRNNHPRNHSNCKFVHNPGGNDINTKDCSTRDVCDSSSSDSASGTTATDTHRSYDSDRDKTLLTASDVGPAPLLGFAQANCSVSDVTPSCSTDNPPTILHADSRYADAAQRHPSLHHLDHPLDFNQTRTSTSDVTSTPQAPRFGNNGTDTTFSNNNSNLDNNANRNSKSSSSDNVSIVDTAGTLNANTDTNSSNSIFDTNAADADTSSSNSKSIPDNTAYTLNTDADSSSNSKRPDIPDSGGTDTASPIRNSPSTATHNNEPEHERARTPPLVVSHQTPPVAAPQLDQPEELPPSLPRDTVPFASNSKIVQGHMQPIVSALACSPPNLFDDVFTHSSGKAPRSVLPPDDFDDRHHRRVDPGGSKFKPHMDGHRINLVELLDLTPEAIEVLRLHALQLFYSEQFQGQLLQDNVPPPPQPQSHMFQQPFPAGEDPSGVLDPPVYGMLGNQPDNVAPPPQPQAHMGQEPFPAGGDLSRFLNPSAFSMAGNQPALPPPRHPSQASPVTRDNDLKHGPPGFVVPPPVPDQAAGPDPPADTSQQHPCPICARIFKRPQERNRHLRTFLPHWIYCPFSRSNCPYRCDRRDNLASHWRKKHADSGQVLPSQEQQYQIYDPDPLVASVLSGQMSMELVAKIALSDVEIRAQELGKGDAWARNWWGRRLKPHTDQQ